MLKLVRASLVIAVLIVGTLVTIKNHTAAETSQGYQSMDLDRAIDMAKCENPDTTIFCYYAYCLDEGSECSFYSGACFSVWGGYCDSGIPE